MFRLHETTRRRVCRTAFVLACAAPTVATLASIAYWHRPWRVSDAEARLSGALRSDVRLADWCAPRPDTFRTSSISLLAHGSTTVLANAADVEVRRIGARETISAGRITIHRERLESTLGQAVSWLANIDAPSLQLTAESLAFSQRDADREFVLQDVQVRVDRIDGGAWTAQLAAKPVTSAANDEGSVRVTIERVLVGSELVTRATIDASAAALPAWLLAAAAPALGNLGADATFLGVVQLELTGGVLSGAARGELRGVSLAATLPAGSPCRAEGVATVTLADLGWRGRHIERLVGAMRGENMQVNRGLLDAATRHLFCGLNGVGPAAPADAGNMVAVDSLACRFEFDRQGLRLWGDFPTAANLPSGCLATSGGAPLLMQPPHFQLPAGYWVQFVAGPSANWMPATQEAVGLAEQLPLPSAVSGAK